MVPNYNNNICRPFFVISVRYNMDGILPIWRDNQSINQAINQSSYQLIKSHYVLLHTLKIVLVFSKIFRSAISYLRVYSLSQIVKIIIMVCLLSAKSILRLREREREREYKENKRKERQSSIRLWNKWYFRVENISFIDRFNWRVCKFLQEI